MPESVSIVVVDDHPLYRSGVVRSLEESEGLSIVGEGATAPEAVALCTELKPDVVLLDISMPGNGIEAAGEIARRCPETRIVMLTASEVEDDIMKALAAGASGYIVKGVGAEDFVSALRAIARGESYVSPGLAARLLVAMRTPGPPQADASPFDTLTAREEQILKLVSQGLSNKEVGRGLDLQEKTVKHYMTTILQKLQARNRVEATLKARERWTKTGQ